MKISNGDIFSIKINEKEYGVGLVVSQLKYEWYFVLFAEKFDIKNLPSSVTSTLLTPILASSSLDAKIHHKHWEIYAHEENYNTFPLPLYKLEQTNGCVVVSFDEEIRKEFVTKEEEDIFKYRKTVAPVRLEKALKAYHGFGEWDSKYDELRYENLIFN